MSGKKGYIPNIPASLHTSLRHPVHPYIPDIPTSRTSPSTSVQDPSHPGHIPHILHYGYPQCPTPCTRVNSRLAGFMARML